MASDPALPFDPATGAWRRPAPAVPGGEPTAAPDAMRKGPLAIAAHILLVLDLGLLAFGAWKQIQAALGYLASGTRPEFRIVPHDELWDGVATALVLMGLVPLIWVVATRQRPLEGTVAYLRLHAPLPSLLRGAGIGLLLVAALIPLGLALRYFGLDEANPVADAVLASMTWPLAIAISLSAAVGEEILFRGILQRWVGVWGQAALFGLSHAGYGSVAQLVLPALLGLLFGFMVRRGQSLWTVIAAHFVFNFVQLSLPLWAPGAA